MSLVVCNQCQHLACVPVTLRVNVPDTPPLSLELNGLAETQPGNRIGKLQEEVCANLGLTQS